jgi:hypothetical protein
MQIAETSYFQENMRSHDDTRHKEARQLELQLNNDVNLQLEADRNSVSVSAPKVGKWSLSA